MNSHVFTVHGMGIIYFWTSCYLLIKLSMKSTELQQQINLKQTELNYEKDNEKRQSIEKAINVLRLKVEIEKIKERIRFLNQL